MDVSASLKSGKNIVQSEQFVTYSFFDGLQKFFSFIYDLCVKRTEINPSKPTETDNSALESSGIGSISLEVEGRGESFKEGFSEEWESNNWEKNIAVVAPSDGSQISLDFIRVQNTGLVGLEGNIGSFFFSENEPWLELIALRIVGIVVILHLFGTIFN